jgi:hypothetical protein
VFSDVVRGDLGGHWKTRFGRKSCLALKLSKSNPEKDTLSSNSFK